jgi:hypothetical protein
MISAQNAKCLTCPGGYSARPCSRIEYRFIGGENCKKAGVRSYQDLLTTLIRMDATLTASGQPGAVYRAAQRQEKKRRAISAHNARLPVDGLISVSGGRGDPHIPYNKTSPLFVPLNFALTSGVTSHPHHWLYSHAADISCSRAPVRPCRPLSDSKISFSRHAYYMGVLLVRVTSAGGALPEGSSSCLCSCPYPIPSHRTYWYHRGAIYRPLCARLPPNYLSSSSSVSV